MLVCLLSTQADKVFVTQTEDC